jgi:hypothetical protein
MKRLAIVLIAGMLAACATTPPDRSAHMRAFEADLDAALAGWQERVSQKYYPTSVAATTDLISRYDEVYARWRMQPDALSQGLMSYSLALADRVDRREISAESANALLAAMKTDIDAEKQRLTAVPQAGAAPETAMLSWWNSYWTANRARYEASQQRPVVCQVNPAAGAGTRVQCL